ncbi:hypothetical protein BD413DRAFT_606060 [Trametes elegans]|nr:hypothetical protein BD413DRAFT_606060 [Trametes elegans]
MALLVGSQLKVPLEHANGGGVKNAVYMNCPMDESAQALYGAGELSKALDWAAEVDVLHHNARFTAPPIFGWCNLGNDLLKTLPSQIDERALRREVLDADCIQTFSQFRHPDVSIYRSMEITDPELQVRGSWQKFKWVDSSRVTSHACVIHKSRLGTFEVYRDVWCLDFIRMHGWRELTSYRASFLNCQMAVHENKAYLFRGSSTIDYFDFDKERWGHIQTQFVNRRGKRKSWPYTGNLTDYVTHIVRKKLYVFEGKYKRPIGCDFFAALDLGTKTWRHLSATHDSEPLLPQYDTPRDKIPVMCGMVDRQAAVIFEKEFASTEGFVHADCWSWDIAGARWQRERVAGNVPCPRAEVSVCYNSSIRQTVIPALPYYVEAFLTCFGFNYFADTFVLDQAGGCTPRWRQVITGSFPMYRAQGQLLTDPATGRMYLFGGYTNTDWVPTGKAGLTKNYGDVWQLWCPDERRGAQLGPWQTCYVCGTVGFWKKCGGTCDGRVFFRTPNCQKEGWAEHKQKHSCTRR